MRDEITFAQKLRICKNVFLKKHRDCLIEHCQLCNSTNIVCVREENSQVTSISQHKCLDCGATANVVEIWKEKEDGKSV